MILKKLPAGLPLEELLGPSAGNPEDCASDYLDLFLRPLHESGHYVKREMPQADPFATWFGLDSPSVIKAKSRAGLVTSVYRQIGLGCERLLLRVLQDSLGIPSESCGWFQFVEGQKRSLDACVRLGQVMTRRVELKAWMDMACQVLKHPSCDEGVVFEVRQGHKSGDSKRQSGDCKNAKEALEQGLLPVMIVFSTQLPKAAHRRYKKDGWLVLTGCMGGGPLVSTYAFFREVLAFDLAGFFEQHQAALKGRVTGIMTAEV